MTMSKERRLITLASALAIVLAAGAYLAAQAVHRERAPGHGTTPASTEPKPISDATAKRHPLFGVDCVDETSVLFPHDVTDPTKLQYVNPTFLGEATPRFRTFLWIKPDAADKVPVYAPVDSDLVEGVYKNARGALDYDVHLMVGCKLWYLVNHITDPVAKVKQALNQVPADNTADVPRVSPPVHFAAGELLGYTTGTPLAHNFDLGVYDLTHKNAFANPSRYEVSPYNKFVTALCPFDSFESNVRDAYYRLFGEEGTPASDARCGPLTPDKAGSISGSWFDAPSNGPDRQLHFKLMIGAYVDGVIRISGEDFPDQVRIPPNDPSYLEPLNVTDEHCYSANGQFVYFKVVGDQEMQVVKGSGVCPGLFPASGSKTYYR